VLLRLGVNHFDRHRLDARDAGRHLGRKHASAVVDRTRLDQEALGLFGDLFVEPWHEVRQGFDEGDFGAQGGVHVAELEADVARAHDGHPLGHELEVQPAVRRVHRFLVANYARRHKGDATRG